MKMGKTNEGYKMRQIFGKRYKALRISFIKCGRIR